MNTMSQMDQHRYRIMGTSATYIHLCSITDDMYAYVKYYGSHGHRFRAAMIGQRRAFDHGFDVVFTGEMCH